MKKEHYKNKEWLRRRYSVEGKTIMAIANECGVSHGTIYNWLVRHGLINNQRKWSKK